jgi:hypothetical protein
VFRSSACILIVLRVNCSARQTKHCGAAADRWTWLIIARHAQLRLAQSSGRRPAPPWERLAAGRLTPARVRRGSGTSGRRPAACPKPADQARAGRSGQRTATWRPATPWGKRRKGNSRSKHGANEQVNGQLRASTNLGWISASLRVSLAVKALTLGRCGGAGGADGGVARLWAGR